MESDKIYGETSTQVSTQITKKTPKIPMTPQEKLSRLVKTAVPALDSETEPGHTKKTPAKESFSQDVYNKDNTKDYRKETTVVKATTKASGGEVSSRRLWHSESGTEDEDV